MRGDLERLLERVDGGEPPEPALLREAARALAPAFPEATPPEPAGEEPLEDVLRLIDACLPGWVITLHGTATAPDGHWRCTLRRSERDDDAAIGHGYAPKVGGALLEALLRVALLRAPG